MNNIEFTKRIITGLGESERRKVIKKATQYGFTVDGFSRKPYDAPITAIMNCMNRKKRNKYQFELLMDVMSEMSEEEGASDILKYVKQWLEDENSHIEIELILDKMVVKDEENIKRNVSIDFEEEQIKYIKKIENIEQELKVARERGKQQKQTIQDNKIKISNLKQNIDRLERENKHKQALVESLEMDIIKLQEKQQIILIKLEKKEEEIKELRENINKLQLFKDNAPKILCILKKEKEVEIPGFDIKTIHTWDDEIKQIILEEEYAKVWLIHNGFTYDIISDIKETFEKEKIKEFNNYNKMFNTVVKGGM